MPSKSPRRKAPNTADAASRSAKNACVWAASTSQPPQIDQQAWGRQAEGENRHQALSSGDDDCLGV
jgi:hypothetical protein